MEIELPVSFLWTSFVHIIYLKIKREKYGCLIEQRPDYSSMFLKIKVTQGHTSRSLAFLTLDTWPVYDCMEVLIPVFRKESRFKCPDLKKKKKKKKKPEMRPHDALSASVEVEVGSSEIPWSADTVD